MLDIGGWEFLLIVVLGIIVIGPKDLPGAIRTVMAFVRKAREMAREFQSGLEEIAHDTELQKIADEVTDSISPNAIGEELRQGLENTIDPEGEMRNSLGGGSDEAEHGLEEAIEAGYDGEDRLDEAVPEAVTEGNGVCRGDGVDGIAADDDAPAPAGGAGEAGDKDASAA